MRRSQKRRIIGYVVVFAMGSLYCVFLHRETSDLWDQVDIEEGHRNPSLLGDPLPSQIDVRDAECKIPELNPFDPSVAQFFKFPLQSNLNCKGPPQLVFVQGTSTLRISQEVDTLKHYGKTECFYSAIKRIDDDINYEVGERQRFTKDVVEATSEFVVVECLNNKTEVVFKDYFPFIVRKTDVGESGGKSLEKTARDERLNVILLGLDSVSRSQFLRQMKQTTSFLRKKVQSYELFAYNKVGANTFPNLLALLANITEDEITTNLSEWPCDDLPFIWSDFKRAGYRTLYAEDNPRLSAFNFPKKGFRKQPTDYYWRPFALAIESSGLITKGQRGCYNRNSETQVILKWALDFLDTFPSKPLFSLTYHSRLNHDNLEDLTYQDKPVRGFLESIVAKGHLNKSVVIIFSDHGLRHDEFRNTYVGRMEDKLPFASLVFPSWFASEYPELFRNLRVNRHRLTTPFDVYATLKDILHFTPGQYVKAEGNGRARSLLSEEIPAERTCSGANIDHKFCACVIRQQTNVTDTLVVGAARKIVSEINAMTSRKRTVCAFLQLNSVLDAHVQLVNGESGKNDVFDFLISLKVTPSEGVFEGIVWYSRYEDTYVVNKHVERINTYRNQSACVDDYRLKPFCYCLTK